MKIHPATLWTCVAAVYTVLGAGCASASSEPADDDGQDSASELRSGAFSLTERALPSTLQRAVETINRTLTDCAPSTNDCPPVLTVRSFEVTASSSMDENERVRRIISHLVQATRDEGKDGVGATCLEESPPVRGAKACGVLIRSRMQRPSTALTSIEWLVDEGPRSFAPNYNRLAGFVIDTVGHAPLEYQTSVVSYFVDDDPDWPGGTVMRSIMIDATSSKVLLFRHESISSP